MEDRIELQGLNGDEFMETRKAKKQLIMFCVFLIFSLLASSTFVYGSVYVKSFIGDDIYISIKIENINSTLYSQIKENQEKFTPQIFPDAIIETLNSKNFTNVYYLNPNLTLNDTDRSLRASFNLGGADIIYVTVNTTSLTKVYTVHTEWRKTYYNFTNREGRIFWSLNFAEYFGKDITEWLKLNYTINGENRQAILLNNTETSEFDAYFYFILPKNALNVKTNAESIIFELPLTSNERLLTSPYPVMAALIVISILAFIYHRIKKWPSQNH